MGNAPDSGELWRLALEHSPVGMTLVGLDGRLLVVNRALCDMLGYAEAELCAKGFQEITHPDDLDADLERFGQAVAGEIDSYRLHKRYLHADGHVVWGDLSVALVRRPDGTPLHFISQILDVTELERERQTLEAIFETVNVGLLLLDRDGHYERMNRRHEETMGLPFPDGHEGEAGQLGYVFQRDGHTLMGREEMPSYRAAQGEEFDELRYWVGRDDATRAAFSVTARNILDANGERAGSVLAYQDVTDLMRALQVKEAFVASVSHELRTPLTAVLGYLELLRDQEDVPPDIAAQLAVVERNARRLEALVADLLHVAQAKETGLQLERAPVDLAGLVQEAVDSARAYADVAGVRLEAELPERLDAPLDGPRLRQVVDNLLSNALKYTRPGGSVRVVLEGGEEELRLTVVDTGMGIDEEEQSHVFNRFYRGEDARRRQIPGTGLGLSIAAAIVEAHGGTLRLESELDVGSTFLVTLPRSAH